MTPLEAITAALEGADEHSCAYNEGTDYQALATAALTAIQGLYVPPPPGSDRDQLPAHLLAVLDVAPYLSTGCQVAQALEAAAERHPDLADELLAWAARKHASCRCNHKSTGQLCVCPHHPVPIAATTEQPPD